MGTLYLIRHGQASFGAADYDNLSETGVEQATRVGQWLRAAGIGFDAVFAGGLRRQQHTAREALAALAHPRGEPDVDPAFDEYDHVDIFSVGARAAGFDPALARGMTRPQFQKVFEQAMRRWVSGRHDDEYRESWPAFQARCHGALARIQSMRGATVAAFSSGGTIATIVQRALDLDARRTLTLNFMLANASVTKLVYRDDEVSVAYLNNYGFLEGVEDGRLVTWR